MIRRTTALALCAALVAASCATGYGPQSFTGGYVDEKIDDTHYRVKFNGNGNTSQERVWNFWMYRCAELTRHNGYSHFALQRPGEPLLMLPPRGPRLAAYREGDDAPRRVRTRGGVTYVPIYVPGARITTWHTDAVVAMFKEPLPENVVVLRAQSVLDELGPYVQSNGVAKPPAREDLYRRAATVNRPETDYTFGGSL